MSCKCAVRCDEYHGWRCTITDGRCEYLVPNSKRCAADFGEGPDVDVDNEQEAANEQ